LAAAAVGAIIGSVAGDGKGAAIGASIGASAGSVYVRGDKDLIFEPGAQMIVRATVPDHEGTATRL